MRTPWLSLAALLPFALGCSSGGEDLSASTVTNLPAGTGTGTAASGIYTVQLDVVSCTGACSAAVAGIPFTICTVGPIGSDTLTAAQNGGRLTVVDPSASVVVHTLAGGIDADGSFDVGGEATAVLGQALTVTTRATGSFTGSAVTGTAESLGTGSVDGTVVDCVQTLTLSGSR